MFLSLPTPRRPQPAGFTLVELATVLAVVAVLLMAALPRLSRFVAARALAAQAGELASALRFARVQALQRGMDITICAAAANAERPACQGPRAADWRFGWLVFAGHDHRAAAAGAPLLGIQQPLQHSGGVAATRGAISFTAAGFSRDAAARFRFDPPPAADAPPALVMCVSKQGRPRLSATEACS